MLRTAFGPAIARFLEDPAIVEVMLNPDGRLWIDRLSGGLSETDERLSAPDGERIVRLVAHHVGAEVHAGSPRVSAELPETGERFEGLLPPVVAAPAFAIRKPAVAVFTLDDYVAAGIMTSGQASALKVAVEGRKNILVAGGTSSGKTTLTNALLAEVAKTSDRVVLIEDTRELQCKAPNLVALRTKDGVISLSDLVRSSLRLRPDRIPIGEVRGAEALDLLKAWGTGHPGGIGTIHAGTALGALRRLEQLIQEAVAGDPTWCRPGQIQPQAMAIAVHVAGAWPVHVDGSLHQHEERSAARFPCLESGRVHVQYGRNHPRGRDLKRTKNVARRPADYRRGPSPIAVSMRGGSHYDVEVAEAGCPDQRRPVPVGSWI